MIADLVYFSGLGLNTKSHCRKSQRFRNRRS